MPCMSYEDDHRTGSPTESWQYKELKANNDKLARIACKAMQALEESQQEDFVLLKDEEVRTWWVAHKEADRKAREAREEKKRIAMIRQAALAKLSDEEKRVLKLKK